MIRLEKMTKTAVAALLALTLPGCSSDSTGNFVCTPGTPATVDYKTQGTFTTTSLDLGGLTVTGSGTVNVLNGNGLGVVGGVFDNTVDGTEYLRFSVNGGAAADVSYIVTSAGNQNGNGFVGEATIEAFDHSGTTLGTRAVNGAGTMDVSTLFADLPISAFVATANVDNFRIGSAAYTPCQ